jgi:hypothetical protein
VQIGDHTTQYNVTYNLQTWTDGVAPPPLATVSGIDSPYRGLNAFGEQDEVFFFGRETAIVQVRERISHAMHGGGVLVVSGASGAGKSSLLRAGVLPRITAVGLTGAPGAAAWHRLLITPSRTPLDALALGVASIARVDARRPARTGS